jgi:predicted anti-sigma-YlaC factor YlaD
MHQEIRHNLEDYLKGSGSKLPAEFQSHLGQCGECAAELQVLETQSQLLQSLRVPRDQEPRAGFYARVMERIESQPASIWSVFLDRKFGLRLAVASAALVALLGTYLVTSEPSGPELASTPAIVLTDTPRTAETATQPASIQQAANIQQDDGLQQQQQRNAVLVDLASYHQ